MRKIWRNLLKNENLINQAAMSGNFIVFDTETTGLHPEKGDQIVEFAAMKCAYAAEKGGFYSKEDIDLFIKPDIPIGEKASEVNGITMEMLEDKPDEREAFKTIHEFLGDSPALGAYNSPFDISMLTYMYLRCGQDFRPGLDVDFLPMARDIFCEEKLPNHKLITIADTYGVTEGIKFHSAIDDVRVLVRVINKMIEDMQKNGVVENRKKIKVFKASYYAGYRGMQRLYCPTSAGMIFYDFKEDRWTSKNDMVNLQEIDMEDVEKQMFMITGRSDYRTLRNDLASGKLTLK